MRSSLLLFIAAAASLAALSSRVGAAPILGTPVDRGDRISGTIDSAYDQDMFRIDLADGERLSVTVKATGKSALLPFVDLFDPEGNPVDLRKVLIGESTKSVSFTDLGLHSSGGWTVSVRGYQGSSGAYQAQIRSTSDRKVHETVTVPAKGTARYDLVGVDGAKVTWTVVEKNGVQLAGASLVDPAGDAIPGTGGTRKGSRLSARNLVLDRGSGRYALVLTGAASGDAQVDVTATVKFPKVPSSKFKLGPEPRPLDLSRWSGCEGMAVTVSGTGFQKGAKVIFGDSDLADEIQFVSSTEISAVTPTCDASRQGLGANVTIVNPDGQFGTLRAPFAFLSPPFPKTISPSLSPLEGGIVVSVLGTNFREGYSVFVDGVASPLVTLVTGYQIDFIAPPQTAGVHQIVLKDEFGRPAEPIEGFWYSAGPTVTQASPSSMPSFGGETVTLTGTGFVPGLRVFVGGAEASGVVLSPMTSLTFPCPAGRAGPVTVEVRDPLDRAWSGAILTMTPGMHDATAASVPAGPAGADFYADSITIGDLTGDGRPEILLATGELRLNPTTWQWMQGSWLLENAGDGRFTDASGAHLPFFPGFGDGGQADAVVLGDLDGDGRNDAVFTRAAPLPTGNPFVYYQGHKGYYDVSFPESTDPPLQTASVFMRNAGDGLLIDDTPGMAPPAYSTPAFGFGERWQAKAAALGDLDGDGSRDLLLVAGGEVRSGFISYVSWSYIYQYPYGYQRDKAVLQQAWYQVGSARILHNAGGGAFQESWSGPGLYSSYYSGAVLDDFHGSAVALGDLDGNGSLDAVILAEGPTMRDDGYGGTLDASALRVLRNDGYGGLGLDTSAIPEPFGTAEPLTNEWWQGNCMALADLDGDGDLDIVIGRRDVSSSPDPGTGAPILLPALRIFRNDGSGWFTEATEDLLPADLVTEGTTQTILGVSGIAVADLDGDGTMDLVVTGRETVPSDPAIPADPRMATRILLNGVGGFHDVSNGWFMAGDLLPADAVAVGDLDGDGTPDLVLSTDGAVEEGKRTVRVFFNR